MRSSTRKIFLAVFFGVSIDLSGCRENPQEEEAKQILGGFTPPFRIIHVSGFRDGGSTGFVLEDSTGKELRFVENQMSMGGKWANLKGRIFHGVIYPTNKGATLVRTYKAERELLKTLSLAYEMELIIFVSNKNGMSAEEVELKEYELSEAKDFLKKRGF